MIAKTAGHLEIFGEEESGMRRGKEDDSPSMRDHWITELMDIREA